MNVGDITANVRAKVNDLRAGIQTAKSEIKGLQSECETQAKKLKETGTGLKAVGDDFIKVGKGVTSVGKTMSLAITAPIAGLATSLFVTGIQFKAFKQEAHQAFSVLLGSSEAAKSHMDDILAFARTTPFAFPDLVDANRRLVSFGMTAKDTHPVMEAIANAVAAMGGGAQDIGELANVFARVQSQGKITSLELNRLGAHGINAVRIMANQAGLSMDEMRSKISEGAIDSKTAIDWLVDGIMNGTEGIAGQTVALGGSLGALKNTWAGAMDSLRGAWRWTADAVVNDELFAKLIEGIRKLTDLVKQLPVFLGPLSDTLGTIISHFIDKLSRMTERFSRLTPEMQQFYIKLGLVLVAAGPVLIVLGKLITATGTVTKAVGGMYNGISTVVGAIAKMGGAAGTASAAAGTVGTAIASTGTAAVTAGAKWAALASASGPLLAVAAVIAIVAGVVKLYMKAMSTDFRNTEQVASDTFDNMTAKFASSQLAMLDSQEGTHVQMLKDQIAHYEAMETLTAEQNAELLRLQEELQKEEAVLAEERKAYMLLKEMELDDAIVKEKGKNKDEILKLFNEYRDQLFGELEKAHNDEIGEIVRHHAEKGTVGSKAFYDDIERIRQQHIERQTEVHRQLGEMLAEYETELSKVGLVYDQELGKIIPVQDRWMKTSQERFAAEVKGTIEQYGTGARRAVAAYRRGLQEETPGAEEAARNLHSRSRNALKEKMHEAEESGRSLGNSFARGIDATSGAVATSAMNLASIVSRYLPRSPAKEGPLKQLPNWRSYLTEGLDEALGSLRTMYESFSLPQLPGMPEQERPRAGSSPPLSRTFEQERPRENPLKQLSEGLSEVLDSLRNIYSGISLPPLPGLPEQASELPGQTSPGSVAGAFPAVTGNRSAADGLSDAIFGAVFAAIRDAMKVERVAAKGEKGKQEVVLELDGVQIGRAIFPTLIEESQRRGATPLFQGG